MEDCGGALGDRQGLLGVVGRVVGRPVGELLAGAVQREAGALPVEQQLRLLEAVAGWADSFESLAAARHRSAVRLVQQWGGGTAQAVTRAQVALRASHVRCATCVARKPRASAQGSLH
jgi:hypothetical protein